MNAELSEAIVNGRCLIFFEDRHVIQKQDVLDSLLYAQLAASRKYPRKKVDFDKWRETWLAAALRFGWVLNASERISQRPPDALGSTLWNWIRSVRTALVPEASLGKDEEVARRSCERYPEQDAISLLAGQTLWIDPESSKPDASSTGTVETGVTLQLGFVGPTGNDMLLIQIHFTSRQSLTPGFLFDVLDPALVVGNVDFDFYSIRLVEPVYSQFRDAFDAALKDKRAAFIEPLKGADDASY
ncbi:hypothetical protein [Pseudomonas sp. NPDC089734]|uniref:hypothetical protein n=1 Tax=Pseudomonas sp. NPDC089734 TaxID=3364469 RepID=UPI0037F97FCF